MRKIILTYGMLSGVVIIGSMIFGLSMAGEDSPTNFSAWVGYLIMLVALSIIFVGIKRYRDQELGGVIKFGTAAKLGLGISLVAAIIYVVVWEINLAVTDYAFIDQYTQSMIDTKKADGVSGDDLAKVVDEMEVMKVRYGNPLFRLPMTFLEIFPVGLLISLLSAALLRNSRFLPARS